MTSSKRVSLSSAKKVDEEREEREAAENQARLKAEFYARQGLPLPAPPAARPAPSLVEAVPGRERRVRVRRGETRRLHGTCPVCGNAYRGFGDRPCRRCATRVRQRRCEEIAVLWTEGLSHQEIAVRVGLTLATVAMEVSQMRRDGWDLPLRPGRHRKHENRVAA